VTTAIAVLAMPLTPPHDDAPTTDESTSERA
jgi:hypothetical protein